MKRPNGIMFLKSIDDIKYICIFILNDDGTYSWFAKLNYLKKLGTLNPFENWLDYIPNKEWIHPLIIEKDEKNGWELKPFDTFNEIKWESESTTLENLHEKNVLYKFFDIVLNNYKNMTDEELEKELNIGKLNTS